MLGCPGNKLACPGSSYPLTGPTLISTVKHIHPQILGPIDPADEGTLGCCTAPQRCPQKKMSLHLPLPLRTELAWGTGDPVTANFLRTTFLSDQKPAYQFPSTLCALSDWCTPQVLRDDMESVFGFQTWRMDSLLSTHEAAFASRCRTVFLP